MPAAWKSALVLNIFVCRILLLKSRSTNCVTLPVYICMQICRFCLHGRTEKMVFRKRRAGFVACGFSKEWGLYLALCVQNLHFLAETIVDTALSQKSHFITKLLRFLCVQTHSHTPSESEKFACQYLSFVWFNELN